LSKCGAYTSHLATLAEDSSVKSVDRVKLKGYLLKWTNPTVSTYLSVLFS